MGVWTEKELLEAIAESSLPEILNNVLFDIRGKISIALAATEILIHDLNNDEKIFGIQKSHQICSSKA